MTNIVEGDVLLLHWFKWQGAIECQATGKIWHAKELVEISKTIATNLSKVGLSSGEVVAVVLGNTAAFPVMLMAVLMLDCNPLLLHPGSAPDEIRTLQKQLNFNWIVHDFLSGITRFAEAGYQELETYEFSTVIVKLLQYSKVRHQAQKLSEINGVILHLSSGTSRESKLCIRDQAVALAEAQNYIEAIPAYHKIRVRITTSLSHAFAYGFGLISALISDSTLVLAPQFNPKQILMSETAKTSDILAVVPAMLQSFLYLQQTYSKYKLPKIILAGGAKCDESFVNEFNASFYCELCSTYGTTETGAIASGFHHNKSYPGVGKILNQVEVKMKNIGLYYELGENIGEIWIKSPSKMQSYLFECSNKEEYLYTGDLGYFDQNQNLFLVARTREIINVHGMKINPARVETILLGYSGIIDCAVYSGRSPAGDEIMLAAISTKKPIEKEQLRSFCFERLNKQMVPQEFYFLDQIPKTPSGKCKKYQLPNYDGLMKQVDLENKDIR